NNDFRKLVINSMTGADGRQRVKTDVLKKAEMILAPKKLITMCEQQMAPLFQQVQCLNHQCQRLCIARDKLLPKLLSGEIEV
ncbi:MAG: hypothetical protein PHV32_11720, partial [Eubacteriales bacterium]|nr:hypothetical protein [Eubacteriales bacterium]